jgi:DNA-directed RNA polymerase specialized sigma24 family protein
MTSSGEGWSGFDYAVLDSPEFLNDTSFRRFVEVLDHMAVGIALDMFVTVLANHRPEQIKAFVMHMKKTSDREIAESLGIDHKTVKRWYEEIMETIRAVSPLGHESKQSGIESNAGKLPKSANGRGINQSDN